MLTWRCQVAYHTPPPFEAADVAAIRVGASRLFDLSRVLDVPISFFFDDMPEPLVNVYGGQSGAIAGRRNYDFAEAPASFGAAARCTRAKTDSGSGDAISAPKSPSSTPPPGPLRSSGR